jgi:hypothetical protein
MLDTRRICETCFSLSLKAGRDQGRCRNLSQQAMRRRSAGGSLRTGGHWRATPRQTVMTIGSERVLLEGGLRPRIQCQYHVPVAR